MTVALPLATFLAGGPLFAQESGDWIRPTKTVRELGRPYAAPQYWAAFIMLD